MLSPNAMSAAPTVSVIVVCKNPGERLRAGLESVWQQVGPGAELIVVDGGSNDGSREWLESERSRLHALISEPDRGVYDAMNKGLAAARTDWVLFMGADDRLAAHDVLERVGPHLALTAAGVVVGDALYDDGRVYRLQTPPNLIARNFVHHQAAFYARALFTRHGGFDPALAVMGDYELNLRLWTQGVRFAPLPLRITACGVGGLSDRGGWCGYREEIEVRHRHFSPVRCAPWDVLSAVRFARKQIVCRFRPRAHE